eukprot:TRINITY_DN66613_c7_g6_i1.p1 TRINITY_DN66613_c7_g6~~TRINITY_DN66613_c7_g6_i1.p1  ORF type:complete len:917 (+),score=451.82 TRINITY_DN66613_c7_g6_i1:394-3144(+)
MSCCGGPNLNDSNALLCHACGEFQQPKKYLEHVDKCRQEWEAREQALPARHRLPFPEQPEQLPRKIKSMKAKDMQPYNIAARFAYEKTLDRVCRDCQDTVPAHSFAYHLDNCAAVVAPKRRESTSNALRSERDAVQLRGGATSPTTDLLNDACPHCAKILHGTKLVEHIKTCNPNWSSDDPHASKSKANASPASASRSSVKRNSHNHSHNKKTKNNNGVRVSDVRLQQGQGQLIFCHLCLKSFPPQDLPAHLEGCEEDWIKTESRKPKYLRRPLPEPVPLAMPTAELAKQSSRSLQEMIDEYNDEAFRIYNLESIVPCPNCNRAFPDEAQLREHVQHCNAVPNDPSGGSPMASPRRRRRMILCYICAKRFSNLDLVSHIAQCKNEWTACEEIKPLSMRNPIPQAPGIPIPLSDDASLEHISEYNDMVLEMHELLDERHNHLHNNHSRRQSRSQSGGRNSSSGRNSRNHSRHVTPHATPDTNGSVIKNVSVPKLNIAAALTPSAAQQHNDGGSSDNNDNDNDDDGDGDGGDEQQKKKKQHALHNSMSFSVCPHCGETFMDDTQMQHHLASQCVNSPRKKWKNSLSKNSYKDSSDDDADTVAQSSSTKSHHPLSRRASMGAAWVHLPTTLVCYLCGREYGVASLEIHILRCRRLWIEREEKLDKDQRRSLPKPPKTPMPKELTREQKRAMTKKQRSRAKAAFDAYNRESLSVFRKYNMLHCEYCARAFDDEEELEVHTSMCMAAPDQRGRDLAATTGHMRQSWSLDKRLAGARASAHDVLSSMQDRQKKQQQQQQHQRQHRKVSSQTPDDKGQRRRRRFHSGTGDGKLHKSATLPHDFQVNKLIPCQHCGRTFNADRLFKHENVCVAGKTFSVTPVHTMHASDDLDEHAAANGSDSPRKHKNRRRSTNAPKRRASTLK